MDNLRKLQLIELDILKEFIRVCEEHGLRYYATDGTALGAVRHKGFIPWDDDIDLLMPREDYERLFDIAKKHLTDEYIVESKFCGINPIMQIKSKKATIAMENTLIAYETHAFIDIQPMDGLPNSKTLRTLHLKTSRIKRALYHISVFKERVSQARKRPFLQRVVVWLCNRVDLQKFFDKNECIDAYDKACMKYSFYKTEYCFSPWSHYHLAAVWKVEQLGEGVKLPFEDIEIVVPTDYDKFLTQNYGNYMELPPESERNHHGVRGIQVKENMVSKQV